MPRGRIRRSASIELMRFDEVSNSLDGFLKRREGARLAHLASTVPKGQAIVEVGAYRGKSTVMMALGSKAGNRAPVHSFDLWTLGGGGPTSPRKSAEPETHDVFRRQVAEHKVKSMVTEHRGDSAQGGAEWDGPPVGLLFVDGNHEAQALQADIDAWLPRMAPGGWLAFHDYDHPRFPDVTKVLDRWVPKALADGLVVEVTRVANLVAVRLGTWAEPVPLEGEGVAVDIIDSDRHLDEPEGQPLEGDHDVMSRLRKIAEEA